MSAESIYTITELTRYIKNQFEYDPVLQSVWLRGELSNVKRHSRGHLYFTVKDENSRVQAVMFAGHNRFLTFKPESGMNVLIRGEINVYEPYGQYQLYAKEMQPDGVGSLFLAYEELKKLLEREGLFAESRKKGLPRFPNRIAVITSPTGAAIRDIVTTLKRRYPLAQITLLPVLVQGDQAPTSIKNAIERVDKANCFDVLIVGRGGGSIEELWAFNDEGVARAIASAQVPIISAVGHETDYTISDFVADLRAPTPTGAAELAVPDVNELNRYVKSLSTRLFQRMNDTISRERSRHERLIHSYAFRYPEQLVKQKEQQLDVALDKLKRGMSVRLYEQGHILDKLDQRLLSAHPERKLEKAIQEQKVLKGRLTASIIELLKSKRIPFEQKINELHLLSPLRLMERGYNLAYDERNSIIKTVKSIKKGSALNVRLKDGYVHCQVVKVSSLVEEEKSNVREKG
ncbi:exodeoxyribonuclease VII large subunit [Alkalihalobacillus hemicellulosilyticus]|uniref:Exodeoxyribonuclease 7 large subunit n=1 Tax=Halalkalibacter hemicellulosilyticusJCM 9152 TaxID=1236971 RepID=W4QIC7_9BACI|nr:exodeoxyribonuclease VII large subunit [Halalkalibacter hemicellulosilyticus]GAE31880.1 exodeoxyribonuclease VII large subunit [Halalkalibacter hemicellulosilyticusJCM 9152]